MSQGATKSLPQRAVDVITSRLSGRRISRRSLLVRSAIAGSALTVNPARFILRPGTAYAATCAEGSISGGWSAMCASINDGKNACPSDSYVAGWWRIDNSDFCRGRARYIVDCNVHPNHHPAECHRHDGECDKGLVACNSFRYGQCHHDVAPPEVETTVKCRIVVCTPPWRWDPACNDGPVFKDPETKTHWSNRLPSRTSGSRINIRWMDLGLRAHPIGRKEIPDQDGPRRGTWARFANGIMGFVATQGTHYVLGDHADKWRSLGGDRWKLGYATHDAGANRDQVMWEFGRTFRRNNGSIGVEYYPFRDVPTTHLFFSEILWLSRRGITRGCNPPANDRFCPDGPVTREQMASFLVRALGLTETSREGNFRDVGSDNVHRTDINRLATAGITRGCNDAQTRFCPQGLVTRGQMAAFLTRAFDLPRPQRSDFDDARGHRFERDIAAIARDGITRGCNPPENSLFCPDRVVTRGQMAAFLYRARNHLPNAAAEDEGVLEGVVG